MKGVCGNPTVFASKKVFEGWDENEELDDPSGYAGIDLIDAGSILVFHDPESTIVLEHGGGLVFAQVISTPGDAKLKKHLAKLPDQPWKKRKGSFASPGGEHVLFDAQLFEEESGKPIRVQLPKGEYVLEEHGIWQPDDECELALVRLVPKR